MFKILKLLFNRVFILLVFLVLQLAWTISTIVLFSEHFIILSIILKILSVMLILGIIKHERHLTNKMPWIIIIMIAPILGTALFIVFGANLHWDKVLRKIKNSTTKNKKYLIQDKEILKDVKEKDLHVYGQLEYISNYANYPVYENSKLEYYKLGEEAYPIILQELEKAEKFIFLEYFIIGIGKMWNSILEILERKVKEGVDVRVIYDDVGCIKSLPYKYNKILEEKGIKCIVFNELKPIMSVMMNSRDHRKILVIDGNTAFSGGINLADEYINEIEKFGHWKDNAIMVKGPATWNFTVMFLKIWNAYRKDDNDFKKFRPTKDFKEDKKDGYIAPYGENPLDDEIVGENIYLNILNQAQKYVYIFTPYLIIDNEMISALTLAVKRGVDVRIVTPAIPDKKIVFAMTRSYYEQLLVDGVKIYEYTPGFVHGKVFVCDDEIATVGTLNLDYRSLYLHFECGTYIYKSKVINSIKKDVLDTIDKSKKVEIKDCKTGFFKGLFLAVLRFFAPLM